MSNVHAVRGILYPLMFAVVLCACTTSWGTITFSNNTLTYSSPSDLGTTIDPSGLNEVAISYGVTKAAFQALSPQVVAFNGAPAPTQTLRTLIVNYSVSNTVTFTFPAAMYNYGSYTSVGRGAFSGSALQDAISTVPNTPDSLTDWLDATISSTGGQGIQALGFCAAFRNDQAVPAGQVLFTLSDETTGSVTLPALGGSGNPEYVFIGYQAPTGKTITRVQASRASTVGGAWVSVDDLSFVMSADATAPAAVTDLATSSPTASSITLTWTAPGDDGSSGTATSYDVRYSTSTITEGNWASATQASGEPAPQVAGTNQNMVVSGLTADTTYYFAIKTSDEVPNVSAISNVPSAKTSDTVAPAAVSNLATSSPTASTITLTWTAPGDNGSTGTAASYDIRYSTSTITEGNWASATQVSGEPTPQVAGTNQNMVVSGLSGDTTYYFAIKTSDEVPNTSALSNVPSGTTSDTVAPAAISNLATSSPTSSSITLTWTAPGDNGSTGTATSYDIRYRTGGAVTDANWASATQVSGEPTPAAAGTNQNMVVNGLSGGTTYYFAIKTSDEVPNVSAISNSPSGTTTGTITFVDNTLTYGSPSDLGTTIDPTGLNEVATSYGVSKASFQALNPQVVGFNGAPAPTQTLRTLEAYYTTSATVTFTFPAAMYNYGSYTSMGRGAFSGSVAQDAISTVPSTPDNLTDWFDATITSTGGKGVGALGLCAAFRSDQAVPAGQVLFTLSDATTGTITLPALGGSGNPQYVFIGYQAPTGKTITRVQASRASTVGGAWVSVDDLSFVMVDNTAPAAVTNLAAGSPTASSITLTWTAPGDDGSTGTAASYDIRYSTGTITEGNWASATQASGEPTPQVAGSNQNMVVSGLTADTTYYFAIKTSDEVPNVSAISNVPSAKTSDTVAPAAVTNLATSSPTASSITLTWTAPGDNGSAGTAASYDIRYSTSTITEGNWASATQVTGEPTPAVAGTNQNMVVSGLSGDTTYYFAMKTSDEVPNTSALSNVPSGTTSDTVAPAAVSNLATSSPTSSSITLTWTAPGDNGSTGTATSYDIRYRTGGPVNDSNWASATQVTGEPTPQVAGTNQNMVVSGLSASTTYYFAIKTSDEVPNVSAISNSPSGTTSAGGGTGTGLKGDYYNNMDFTSFVLTRTDATVDFDWGSGSPDPSIGADTFSVRWTGQVQAQYTETYTFYTYSDDGVRLWVNGQQVVNNWTDHAPTENSGQIALSTGVKYDITMEFYENGGGAVARLSWSSASTTKQVIPQAQLYPPAADATAPAAVTNLATGNPTSSSITLTWTAPGDDGNTGTATSYDIRYRTGGAVNDSNWASATQVTGEPAPQVAGTNQNMVVGGLSASTTYYFAIKTSDEVPNVSAISNSPSGTTTSGGGGNPKPILGQSDFVYQGYYIVQRDGNYNNMAELEYGQGFTHRYVSGQLRFLTFSFFGNVPGGGPHLIEFAPPAGGLGGTITTRTNHWPDIWGSTGLGGGWLGLWFEQSQNRLWTTWAIDYPDDVQGAYTKSIVVRTLNADGTVSNVQGPWGLQGIQQRRVYGGVAPVPAWFQSTYGTGPYSVGWGGYASRMGVGPVSLGPTCYTFPEPTGYPVGDIPTSAFKSLMDHSSSTLGPDWYAQGYPTTGDRGVRNTDVDNDYDTPYWQSPAPDGLGRWTWGDSNWNTGCWIETPNKQGFILIPKLCNGRTWYETSTLHCERQSEEIQVFDPNMLGEVAQGTRASWNTYPTNRWEITSTLTPLGFNWARSGNGPDGGACGASYDSTTQTLYVYCVSGNNRNSYILLYHVN